MSELASMLKTLPRFSGKEEDFSKWKKKFIPFSKLQGFYGIMMGTEKVPAVTTSNTDAEKAVIKRAMTGFNCLQLSLNGTAEDLIDNMTEQEVDKAWALLEAEYCPKTYRGMVRKTTDYFNIVLKDFTTDPTEFFNELKSTRDEVNSFGIAQIDEALEIAIILSKLPMQYQHIVASMLILMDVTVKKGGSNVPDTATLAKTVKKHIRDFWLGSQHGMHYKEPLSFNVNSIKGNDFPRSQGGHMGGMCFKCGESGHMKRECTVPYDNLHCSYCKKNGHVALVCQFKRWDVANKEMMKGGHDSYEEPAQAAFFA